MNPILRAYRAGGCRTDEQIIEMARLKGESAVIDAMRALREERENSTALVVVPGTAPGKNLSAFLRNMVGQRTKLIVVSQPGDLGPGAFEQLLRASMPDIERKLRIIDGGDSIADAVSSAEANHHYTKSHALEVYADPQLAANFTQEVKDGGLNFDPSVIMVNPTEIPTDDPGDIMKAVQDDDLDAMHRVLDPHVFSDATSLQRYKDALRGQAREGVVREFLTDIAPSREIGIQRLDAILRAELGDAYDDLEYLGSGRNGSAYRTSDGLILKVTTDKVEVESAARLKGLQCEYIHHIYEVLFTEDPNVWMILQEGGLEKLPQQYCEEFDTAMEALEVIGAGHHLRQGDTRALFETMMRSEHTDLCMLVAEVMKKFEIGGMLREMAALGLTGDFHSGNIMLREGCPVLTDLGTPGDDPSDITEAPDNPPKGQRAKRPFTQSDYYPNNGQFSYDGVTDNWPCPHCGVMIAQGEEYPRNQNQPEDEWDLCPECGGELDWTRGEHMAHLKRRRSNVPSPMGASKFPLQRKRARGEQKGPPDGDPQVNELAGAQAAPQAGPRSQMRGSNSSAWAGGKMVLSKPEAHVPEDENESERDGSLDTDIVGGGLNWGSGLNRRGY